jgi:hypothetical protein
VCLTMSFRHLLQGKSVIIEEERMALDKIIVLVMATAFFGSLIYLALKGRREETRKGHPPSSPNQHGADAVVSTPQSQEKERRNPLDYSLSVIIGI